MEEEVEQWRVRDTEDPVAEHEHWVHGRALPLKPPSRFDMDISGAILSTWKAGESLRYVCLCGPLRSVYTPAGCGKSALMRGSTSLTVESIESASRMTLARLDALGAQA